MSKKCKYPELKAEIKNQEAESKAIRKQIHGSSGKERWDYWDNKRTLGFRTRCLLLLYAMLRGVPYRVVEPKSDSIILSFYVIGLMEQFANTRGLGLTRAAITEWINAKPAEVAA
jgi:hypothetical protein